MPRDSINVGAESRERLKSKKTPGGVATVQGEGASTDATEKEAVSSALSSGKAAKGGGEGMPKQEPGESPAAFGERMRQWRAKKPKAAVQGKALGGY